MKNTLTKEVTTLTTAVATLVIATDGDMITATEKLSQMNKQLDIVKTHEAKILKPLNEAIKAARAEWKPLKNQLDSGISLVRRAMSEYQTKKSVEAEEKKEKIAARIGEGKGKLKVETALNQIEEVESPVETVAASSGMVSFVTDYEIIVDDITKVPFEYLKVEVKRNEVKIATKAGKTIPGLTVRVIQVPKNFR